MSSIHIKQTDKAVQTIGDRDPLMNKLITTIGNIEIVLRTDKLASLVRSIIGQQISFQAADAIYVRVDNLLGGEWQEETLLRKTMEELRSVGLTYRKAEYVQGLAEKVASKKLDLENIAKHDNQSVIQQLVQVKGIGKWTAEVFLMLTLGREDVLAADDVALQRAAMWLYGTDKTARRQTLIEKAALWKPYRSIASYYLWEAIHLGFTEIYPSLDELGK